MGKPIAPDPSINSKDDYSEMLEAFKAFGAAVPPEPTPEVVVPKPSGIAPTVAPIPAPAPTLDTAAPVLGPPRAPEPVSLPDEAGPDPFKSPHPELGWLDRLQHYTDKAAASINPPETRKRLEAGVAEQEARDHDVEVWRKTAEDEAKRVVEQLSMGAGDVPINMVDIGDRYGLNISDVRRSLIHDALRKRSDKEYPGYTWANVETGMRAAGVDPYSEKKKWAAEATKEADTRIKLAFADKKHLTAISVDSEGLKKELLEYSQIPIMERTRIPYTPVGVVPVPWSTAEIMSIVAPKDFTVSVPGGVNAQLTPAEIKGEEWGDHVPRVVFDLVQAAAAARYKTFMKEGGKDIAPTAFGTIERDGNLGDRFPELRKLAPFNPTWQMPMFAKSVHDGDVKRAFDIYVEASAKVNGYGKSEEEREEYVDLLRSNPAFRDILQKEYQSLFAETWDSMFHTEMPGWMKTAVGVPGYINGMVLGDFVIPDPVAIITAGTSELIGAGWHLYKLRQAETLVANTEKLIKDAATTPDTLRTANALIDPAFADHQMDVVKVASRLEAGATAGVKVLEHDAHTLLDQAAKLRQEAGEAPAKAAESVKKAVDETKQAVADTEWAAADKAAKLKDTHAEAIRAAKLVEAERKTAEAADLLEKTELIRTEQAAKDARKVLEDYATNNDPIKARIVKAYKEADTLDRQHAAARAAAKEFGDANVPVLERVVPTVLEADRRYGDVLKHGSDLGDATIEADKAQTKLREALEQLEKARTGKRGGGTPTQGPKAVSTPVKVSVPATPVPAPAVPPTALTHVARGVDSTPPVVTDPTLRRLLSTSDPAKATAYSFDEVYDALKAEVKDDPLSIEVLEAAKKVLGGSDLTIHITRKGEVVPASYASKGNLGLHAGAVQNQHGTIWIKWDTDYRTVVHEIVHATSVSVLSSVFDMHKKAVLTPAVVEAANDIFGLYIDIRKYVRTLNAPPKFYGLSNEKEFVAEALSNAQFQDFLRGLQVVKTPMGLQVVTDANAGTTSVWGYLVEKLSSLLGLKQDTALAHVLKAYDTFTSSERQVHRVRLDRFQTGSEVTNGYFRYRWPEGDAFWDKYIAPIFSKSTTLTPADRDEIAKLREAHDMLYARARQEHYGGIPEVPLPRSSPEILGTGVQAAKAPPKELARLRAMVKKEAEAVQAANVKVADIKKALDTAKVLAAKAQAAVKALPPEQLAVWKKLMALEDKASESFSRAAMHRQTLVAMFGDDIPDTLLDADKAMRQQLLGAYEQAKKAYQTQVTKAGGTTKALAKALQGKKQAEAALEAVRQARQAHAAATVERIKAVAAKGAARVGEKAQRGVTRVEKAVQSAEDATTAAKLRGEQAEAWRREALGAAKRYRDGLRLSGGIQQAAQETRTTKQLITQGLLKETSNKVGFLVDVPKLLARLEQSIGSGGVKWLSEQTTDTGRAVKKLTGAIGGLQLTPQEVRALEQGVEAYNTARVMGHTQKEAILTYNTVKGLQAIEHTKQGASWHKKLMGSMTRWMRVFDNNTQILGAVEDTLPGIARAATNKGAQAKDELAYIKTRGKWGHVSEYGRRALQALGIHPDKNVEGATHAALIFEYLGTTRPLPYAPGATLLNTSTVTGKSLFEQFRRQVLSDARVTEFLARAQKATTDEELDLLALEHSDSVAPYLLGVARAWYPSSAEKVNPQTAMIIMRDMVAELHRGAEAGDDLPVFIKWLRARTEQAPAVGTTYVKDGVEVSGLRRPRSTAGLGSSDKDVVRVMGFLGDLIAHGSNLFETEHLLTKAVGGVIDPDTIKHVDAFIAGKFEGVDGKPIDVVKVMAFFNRLGIPMSSDKFKLKDWAGKVGERAVRIQALQNDPSMAAWVTRDLVKALDSDLGKVVKTLEGRTRYDGVPDMGTGARLANLWRRSVTVGLLGPKPAFWVGNYLGNITQTWTVLGAGKAGQVMVNDAWTNMPFVGKWGQDFMSRQAMKARGTPVLGPVMDWFFNPHIAAVMNGDNGWIRLKNGAVIDYATLRREAIEYGVVDTMLREDLSTVFARRSQQGWASKVSKVLWSETDFHRSMSDFQTMTQQRSRMSLYLRLRDEGHPAGEAGRLLNDALFDWKHGAPAIGALMNLLPFWRFFALGHRQAFRAEMQGFYDTKGALRGVFGDSQMGRLRQQRAVVGAIEDTFLPTQQGPYASEEEQRMAMAANLDPAWNHDKVRFGMSELPPSVQRQIMEDSGQVKTHAMYHLWKPTSLAFMDTHFAFTGAATAQLYAGAYGDSVESRGVGAFGEAVSSVVDDTVPWLSDPIHQVLNSVGLDPEDGSTAQSVAASNGQAQIIKTVCASMGWDHRALVWQPRGANGEYRMTPWAAVIAQLPYMNDIIPHHARIALSPYRMEKDERAVKMVTHAMSQMLGFGPVFFSPEKTVDWTRRDIKENIGKLVPPGADPQFQGRIKVEEPPKEEVDK